MPTPDLTALWDFADPAASEARFRDLLATIPEDEPALRAEVLSQIARAQGLRGDFAAGHATIEEALPLVRDRAARRTRARLLLEHGRLLNSAGKREEAAAAFRVASAAAEVARDPALLIDALHMQAIVAPPDEALAFNRRALRLAEGATDPAARRWVAPLLNNIGWTLFEAGDLDGALTHFEPAVHYRRLAGQPRETRIAEWAVARCLRALGRLDDALAIQERLATEGAAAGEPDPFVAEELGECLLALGRADEARPHFAAAHAALAADPWLTEHEPARIARLRELAG